MAKKLQPGPKVETPTPQTPVAGTGATPRAGSTGSTGSNRPDPALEAYAEALNALYRQDWETSARLFESVVRDGDRPELAERARQLLAVSRQRQNGAAKKEAEESDP